MAKAPKRPRKLPEGIAEKSDAEVAEAVFGKELKAELDRIAGISPTPTKEV